MLPPRRVVEVNTSKHGGPKLLCKNRIVRIALNEVVDLPFESVDNLQGPLEVTAMTLVRCASLQRYRAIETVDA